MVPLATETDVFPLTYTENGITYGVCFEDGALRIGSVSIGASSSIQVYYDGFLCEIFNISFNGSMPPEYSASVEHLGRFKLNTFVAIG